LTKNAISSPSIFPFPQPLVGRNMADLGAQAPRQLESAQLINGATELSKLFRSSNRFVELPLAMTNSLKPI
jgi:hypothetical protein